MSATGLTAPAGQASSRFFKFCAQVVFPTTRRHQSSARRTRSRLNVKPDTSFLPSTTETHDHIIFNPPPSMPNVYHTPTIFLPKSDKRRQLQQRLASSGMQMSPQPGYAPEGHAQQLPPVHPVKEKRYHITPDVMDEMRELRKQDPYKWSVLQLARKFDCSKMFVKDVIAGLAPEKLAQQKLLTAVVQSRWGIKRKIARQDRALRKERWGRE